MPRAGDVSVPSSAFETAVVDVGQQPVDGELVHRVEPCVSRTTRSAGIDDETPQPIFRVLRRRVGADHASPALRDLGFRLNEIERRDLPGRRPGLCSGARALPPAPAIAACTATFATVALSVQCACLTAATVCTIGLAETQLRALLIAFRDDAAVSRRRSGDP
mgnify:CR=1 FL=1